MTSPPTTDGSASGWITTRRPLRCRPSVAGGRTSAVFAIPEAKKLILTADGGGSNGSRLRLWKRELQRLSNELGIDITVSHFPPGTSKWNKIEHRLFSYISQNWRATPLISYRVIVNLIAATTTRTGLSVHCELDTNQYPKGIVVPDAEMAAIAITRAEFHGEWNYTISPNKRSDRAVDSLTGPKTRAHSLTAEQAFDV